MALMDFIKKQFIDILQWTEEGDGTLAWRFPMAGNGNPERRQPDGARLADGDVRQ
jgi:membrane protease subunit (stomatin/prohibitin family)